MRLLLLSLASCAGQPPLDFPREGDEAALVVRYELDDVLADATVEGVGVWARGEEGTVRAWGAVDETAMLLLPPGTWTVEASVDTVEEDLCTDYAPVDVSAGPSDTVEVTLSLAYAACLPDQVP